MLTESYLLCQHNQIPATLPTPHSPRVGESKAVADGTAPLPLAARRGVIADGAA